MNKVLDSYNQDVIVSLYVVGAHKLAGGDDPAVYEVFLDSSHKAPWYESEYKLTVRNPWRLEVNTKVKMVIESRLVAQWLNHPHEALSISVRRDDAIIVKPEDVELLVRRTFSFVENLSHLT